MAGERALSVPVLLVAWRRPHTTRQVLDALRPLAPQRLFVACDGPRSDRPGEAEQVAATRALIEAAIDWPCRVERLYSDGNQGCRLGVSRAISWFFEQVEEGIILEDDCVPHADFLPYAAALLERYRHDLRVWSVSGDNFQEGRWRGEGSYYFSRYMHCWGWASWRSRWRHYDADLALWPPLRASGLLSTLFEDPVERRHWSAIWTRLHEQGQPDSWAYRWAFTCLVNGGLTALPNSNLVCNVGFGADGTHCTSPGEAQGFGSAAILPLRHPAFMLRDAEADRFSFDHHFGGAQVRRAGGLVPRLLNLARTRGAVLVQQPGHYPRKLWRLLRRQGAPL